MLGDFLREAAVLVIVFFPLEYFKALSGLPFPPGQQTVRLRTVAQLSGILLVAGMALEKIDFGRMAIRLLDYGIEFLQFVRKTLGREDNQ
jgi:hypothetical protein